jgi:hypothetical protein
MTSLTYACLAPSSHVAEGNDNQNGCSELRCTLSSITSPQEPGWWWPQACMTVSKKSEVDLVPVVYTTTSFCTFYVTPKIFKLAGKRVRIFCVALILMILRQGARSFFILVSLTVFPSFFSSTKLDSTQQRGSRTCAQSQCCCTARNYDTWILIPVQLFINE